MKIATFAGGCFWCTEHDLKSITGVISAMPGYANSSTDPSYTLENKIPTYDNHNGFREAVSISYDESKISFKKLCQFYLDSIDPTDDGGQFYDRGFSYTTAIFCNDESESVVAAELLSELTQSEIFEKPISVQVLPIGRFFPAEEYHRDYSAHNPESYMRYRIGSGREAFVQNTCRLRNDFPWKS